MTANVKEKWISPNHAGYLSFSTLWTEASVETKVLKPRPQKQTSSVRRYFGEPFTYITFESNRKVSGYFQDGTHGDSYHHIGSFTTNCTSKALEKILELGKWALYIAKLWSTNLVWLWLNDSQDYSIHLIKFLLYWYDFMIIVILQWFFVINY